MQEVRRYEIRDEEFIKFGVPCPATEFEKCRAISRVAESADFLTPKTIRYDLSDRSVTYQYLHDINPIRDSYLAFVTSDQPRAGSLSLIARAGAVLARIHASLELPRTTDWQPTPAFAAAFAQSCGTPLAARLTDVPWANAHCDYGFSNVQVSNSGSGAHIVVLDPCANGFVTTRTNLRAPIYVDIANFAACIYGLVSARHQLRIKRNRIATVLQAFVSAYEGAAGMLLDKQLLAHMTYATAACYIKHRVRGSLVQRAAMAILFGRLKSHSKIST